MPDADDWNRRVIEEFRAHQGKVSGPYEGKPVLLLHHTGARSGTKRVNPLLYRVIDGNLAVFASKGGAPNSPAWYYNLVAHPEASVEVGTDTVRVVARVAEGDERERIWQQQKTDYPQFADYERKTTRRIPVVVLERAA